MIDVSYPNILNCIENQRASRRSESAAFLIWYLENYLRLDPLEAVDSVCDQSGDKGVDGIYLNSDSNTIEIYQSKLFQKADATVGDKLLREFQGTLSQFSSESALDILVTSAGDGEVGRLITRLELNRHLREFDVIGYFVCNSDIDANGSAFLKTTKDIRFIGKKELESSFIDNTRTIPTTRPKLFTVAGYDIAEYIVDKNHRAIIAPVKASELVEMDGIINQAIFAFNVRGPLGRTQVNVDIAKSISEFEKHKLFPLFHNGITIVAEKVNTTSDTIEVENYYVVNGCQSLNVLFMNKKAITDDLRILTKFIQTPPISELAEMVTRFSNNQNGVKARDFKSNNHIQIRLQNEFSKFYGANYFYEIKRGEYSHGTEIISNEDAGQYLMAFDLKIPWATHRKYQIFEDLHADLFGRPIVTAHRIVMCHLLISRIETAQNQISNPLFAKYALTKFFLLFVMRLLLENDPTGMKLIETPEKFVLDEGKRFAVCGAIDKLLVEVITDLNAEIDQLGEDFDYRGKLRDDDWCNKLAHEIAATHKKLVDRKRLESFAELIEGMGNK